MSRKRSSDREETRDAAQIGREAIADLFNLAVILALVVLFFLDVILRGQVFFAGDIMNVYSPWQMYNHQALTSWRLPLWTDDFFMGFPLFAESQGALFYPPTRLVYLLAPISQAFSYDVLLHFFLAGWFQYFLARTLRLAPAASLLAAIAFAFSGMFLSLPINFTIFRSIVWIPLIFALLTIGARSGSLFYPLMAAVALVFQMMGGSLQVTGITVLALIPYVIFLIVSPGKGRQASLLPLLQLILTLMLAFGLNAFQLGPTFELSLHAWRGTQAGYDLAASFSFPPIHFFDVLFPTIFGKWGDGTLLPVVPVTANFFPYIGLAPLLLTPIGLAARKRGMVIMFVLAAFFILLALGRYGPLFPIIYNTVPFFDKFRAPDRFWCVAVMAGSLLAGFGLDRLMSDIDSEKPPISTAVSGLLTFIFLLVTLFLLLTQYVPEVKALWPTVVYPIIGLFFNPSNPPFNPEIFARWRDHLALILLHGFAAITAFNLAIWLFARKDRAGALALAVIFVTVADLYMMSFQIPAIRTTGKSFFIDPPRTAQVLLRDGEPNRFFSHDERLYAQEIFKFPPEMDDTVWYNGGGSNDINDYIEFREELSPDFFMHWGLQSSNGFASLFLENWFRLKTAASEQLAGFQGIDQQTLQSQGIVGSTLPVSEWSAKPLLIDLMASRYVLTPLRFSDTDRFGLLYEDQNPEDGRMRVYMNRRALPRAWVATPGSVLAETPDSLQQLIRGEIDPTGTLILDPLPLNPRTFPQGSAGGSARIRMSVEPGRARRIPGSVVDEQVNIDVHATQPAYLFLADTFYPGWYAEIDGQKVDTIYRAFGYFRAIEIPEGDHVVRFYYHPPSFYAGAILSGIILITAILLVLVQAFLFRRPKLSSRDED